MSGGAGSRGMRVHACLDCDAPHRRSGEFCGTACRTAFNNRRKARGAELYDLYMAHRFDRGTARDLGVFQAINRLASLWRQEDRAARVSRRSWRTPKAVLAERPYLKAIATAVRAGR